MKKRYEEDDGMPRLVAGQHGDLVGKFEYILSSRDVCPRMNQKTKEGWNELLEMVG